MFSVLGNAHFERTIRRPAKPTVRALRSIRLSRREFLASCGLAVPAAAAYGHWIEPRWLALRRHRIQLIGETGGETPPVKLLHLSDLHWSSAVTAGMIRAAVDLALRCQPDVVCLTGDFVTGNDADPDTLAELLSPLARIAPTFASLGNHDGGAWARYRHDGYKDTQAIRAMLASAGITHLDNTSETLTLRGRPLRVCGVGDLWAGEFRPHKVLLRGAADIPTILLSHNPDTKDSLTGFGWHLLLAGHTHGGQLRVPLVGTPFAPVRDKRFVRGVHRWENRWLAVSAGVGNLYGTRFNCRPEISELTLV